MADQDVDPEAIKGFTGKIAKLIQDEDGADVGLIYGNEVWALEELVESIRNSPDIEQAEEPATALQRLYGIQIYTVTPEELRQRIRDMFGTIQA